MQSLLRPPAQPVGNYVLVENVWLEAGPLPLLDDCTAVGVEPVRPKFVSTPSIAAHLRNLARAVLMRRYPVLLQVLPP